MSEKMICENCGREMNQHAEKVVYVEDGALGDVKEIHACPGCGESASRPSRLDSDQKG
jgi:predicted RNA-binding Zn-ribbon protein involved in translation (DUF1610 family)